MIQQTSLESYKKGHQTGDFTSQREKVLRHLYRSNKPLSYNDISRQLHMHLQSVCGRMGDLRREFLVEEADSKWDYTTRRKVKTWRAK